MTIRLNKVTRDLNVGITTVVEFLQKKGFTVESNPNTKITDEQFEMLRNEFSTDKDLKLQSERFSQERQMKERGRSGKEREPQNAKAGEEIKTVVPEEVRPKVKPVGKIDLDKLNKRKPVVEEKGEDMAHPGQKAGDQERNAEENEGKTETKPVTDMDNIEKTQEGEKGTEQPAPATPAEPAEEKAAQLDGIIHMIRTRIA